MYKYICLVFVFLASASAFANHGLLPLGVNRATGRAPLYISTIPMSWDAAQDYCDYSGMKIVSLPNARKDEEVRLAVKAGGYQTSWTSGNDLAVNNKYIWASNMQEFTWHPWQFDNNQKPRDIGKSCMLFQSETGEYPCVSGRKWDEELCTNQHHVVCEL